MTWSYSAFGLSLDANSPIPGLVPRIRTDPADVAIWLNAGASSEPSEDHYANEWYVSDDREGWPPALRVWRSACGSSFRLMYADGTEFLVDSRATEIRATWPASSTLADTATYLLGPVLGFVLRLRGIICLHASAVATGGRAIAFAGPAEAGKSTLAAAFALKGLPVLADDIVALTASSGVPHIRPAYSQLRLWPDTTALLYGSAERLPRLTPGWDKRALDLSEEGYRFQEDPLPLEAVYLLEPRASSGTDVRIEDVEGRRALHALIANSYASYLLDTSARAHELAILAEIARRVPVRRVVPLADPRHLPHLCERILEDAEALGCIASPITAR